MFDKHDSDRQCLRRSSCTDLVQSSFLSLCGWSSRLLVSVILIIFLNSDLLFESRDCFFATDPMK